MKSILNTVQKKAYQKQGYLILKHAYIKRVKTSLKNGLKKMALVILKNHPTEKRYYAALKNKDFAEIFNTCIAKETNNAISRAFYELFPLSLEMNQLLSDEFFLQFSKELGVAFPVPSTLPILRIDRPSEAKYLTPAHQDYWYSMISPNSLTYWFPILPVTEDMGHLLVAPGTHVQGLRPIKPWTSENPFTLRDEVSEKEYIPVSLADDEVVVFSQCLVHKSGINLGKKARLTLQLRHNDVETLIEQSSSFTAKYSRYTAKAQEDWLKRSELNAVHA